MRECFYVVSILCDGVRIQPSAVHAAMDYRTIFRTNYSIVYLLSLPAKINGMSKEYFKFMREKKVSQRKDLLYNNLNKIIFLSPFRDKLIEL